jgi:hypothetical protein
MQAIVFILGAAAAVLAFLYMSAQGRLKQLEEQNRLLKEAPKPAAKAAEPARKEQAREPRSADESAELRKQLDSARKQLDSRDVELKKLRDDLKESKGKAHQLSKTAESQAKRAEKLESKQKALGTDELNQRLAEARKQVSDLKAELDDVRARGGERVVEKIVERVVEVPAAAGGAPTDEALQREVADLRRQLREQADAGRKVNVEQIREEREKVKKEVESLRKRLTKALTDTDKERRRADNLDRAYLIMKSQLESALDRAAAVDLTIRRPDAVYFRPPEVENRRKKPKAEAAAPVVESAPEPEAVVEAAAPEVESAPEPEAERPAIGSDDEFAMSLGFDVRASGDAAAPGAVSGTKTVVGFGIPAVPESAPQSSAHTTSRSIPAADPNDTQFGGRPMAPMPSPSTTLRSVPVPLGGLGTAPRSGHTPAGGMPVLGGDPNLDEGWELDDDVISKISSELDNLQVKK